MRVGSVPVLSGSAGTWLSSFVREARGSSRMAGIVVQEAILVAAIDGAVVDSGDS